MIFDRLAKKMVASLWNQYSRAGFIRFYSWMATFQLILAMIAMWLWASAWSAPDAFEKKDWFVLTFPPLLTVVTVTGVSYSLLIVTVGHIIEKIQKGGE